MVKALPQSLFSSSSHSLLRFNPKRKKNKISTIAKIYNPPPIARIKNNNNKEEDQTQPLEEEEGETKQLRRVLFVSTITLQKIKGKTLFWSLSFTKNLFFIPKL